MTAMLTENLSLLAGAPNGIKKLRELILELAVRGKLVSQDPNDEPASDLLRRITEEKNRLVADGKIQTLKLIQELPNASSLPNLPRSWRWVRFGEIAQHNSGKTLDKGRNTGIPRDYITTSNLYWGRFELDNVKQMLIRENELNKCTATKNDLLICEGGEAGRAAVWVQDKEICFQNHIHRARFYGNLSPHYAQRFFEKINATGEINQFRKGIGISNMSSKALASITFPLPPLAEQHRIVAKVDELMVLCDHIEAQQANAESAHAQLIQALLDSLTQASDSTDFAANWQRMAEHFHILFTSEPSIDALKQTLLQLAVMGKLVPQDLNDEPASELLNRITQEKARLVAEGKLKKQKPLVEITEAERPFAIPGNWHWSRIGELALSTEYGLSEKTSDLQGGVPVLKMGDIQSGEVLLGEKMKVSKATEGLPELYLKSEDLLYNRTNSAELVGKTGLFLGRSGEFTFASYLIRIRCPEGLFSPAYLNMAMNAPGFRETQINPHLKQQCGQANVNGTIMKNMVVSVPPVAEQFRIVAKVGQLMALCNQLKNRITHARQLNEKLAVTLVERALADDGKQTLVATDLKAARILLGAEVTHRLHAQRTFGQRKLQKVLYLAEHAARLEAIQGNYLRNVAGPHDRHLMSQIEAELQRHQWYERIDRQTVGHAYRPLSQAGQHRQVYNRTWSANEQAKIEQVIELMRDWDTDRCEMTVTLYAAWNDFIIEGRPVTDKAIVDEIMHRWNEAKLRFSRGEWLAVLSEMKKHDLLTPTGFGKRTTGGTLSLPGID